MLFHLSILLRTAVFYNFIVINNAVWHQPQIFLHRGYVNIYEHPNIYVGPNDVIVGEKYTMEITMDETDQYDYLIQRCNYNSKYHFIDHNSCLIPNNFFVQKWENDAYGYPGVSKRTLVHFNAPEPLTAIECRVKIIQCCGCAERACSKDVTSAIQNCPQQVINIHTNKPDMMSMDVPQVERTEKMIPWWLWLLLALLLLLLLCCFLSALIYWLLFKKKETKRVPIKSTEPLADIKTSEEQISEQKPDKTDLPVPVLPPVELSQKPSDPYKPRRPDGWYNGKQRIYYTPSESPSESFHSSISRSRPAFKMTQRENLKDGVQGVARVARISGEDLSSKRTPKQYDEGHYSSHEGQFHTAAVHQKPISPSESKASQTLITSKTHHNHEPSSANQELKPTESHLTNNFISSAEIHPSSSLPVQTNGNADQQGRRKQTSRLEEKYFTQNYPTEHIREEGYDQVQYRYVQHYAESESA